MEFKEFTKIARLSRDCVITEKIDGTNGLIAFDENMNMKVGSRSRWITPDDDNHGFARWAYENVDELKKLGEGYHYGEWWGSGIQRRYGMDKKVFSLFNTHRWSFDGVDILKRPDCCSCVPVLYKGIFETEMIRLVMRQLRDGGSVAAKGYNNPEGIIIYHTASQTYYKKTFEKDEGKSIKNI